MATNRRLVEMAIPAGAKLVLNTDGHSEDDLVTDSQATAILRKIGLKPADIMAVFNNSRILVKNRS
jgi:histidinol phosphatase-like PHP family hydrolase